MYARPTSNDIIIPVIYIDYLVITGSAELLIHGVKRKLCQSFVMIDLGLLHYCLGVEVWQQLDDIFVSQSKHAWAMLDKFRMQCVNLHVHL